MALAVSLHDAAPGQTSSEPVVINLCDVVASPASYNHKLLSLEGILLPGDHSVLLYSPSCKLWLGHESIETTQIYLDANLAMKEEALAKVPPFGKKVTRYKPDDSLLAFLSAL
jgi:hypothetical protein